MPLKPPLNIVSEQLPEASALSEGGRAGAQGQAAQLVRRQWPAGAGAVGAGRLKLRDDADRPAGDIWRRRVTVLRTSVTDVRWRR
jgi:hypothetical protein